MTNSTIARLQSLLVEQGYDIKRLTDTLLVMPVMTVSYRDPGEKPTAHDSLTSAMTAGDLEPPSRASITTATTATSPLMEIARWAGGVNRLKPLFEFRKTLEREQNIHKKENSDGDHVE